MSLRDALLAKGIVSKKDAQRVERELKQERRANQGNRRAQSEVDAEQRLAIVAAEEAERLRKIEDRRRREAEREAIERPNRIRQIIRGNIIRSRGPFRFHHRTLDSLSLGRLELSERVAWKLRCGECAIAASTDLQGNIEYVVISERAAQRLAEFAPEVVVFHTQNTIGLDDPSERLMKPEWDISLKPHRWHPVR